MTGFGALTALLAGRVEDPSSVAVAIETEKDLLVSALRAAGFTVYAINPRAVARCRERYGQAGGKSDPGDAVVLADGRITGPGGNALRQPSSHSRGTSYRGSHRVVL